MTAAELKAIRKTLGLSQKALADALGLKSYRTVQAWEYGQNPIVPSMEKLINQLKEGKL